MATKPIEPDKQAQLYIIACAGYPMHYKVGISKDVARRVAECSTWHPYPPLLLCCYSCPDAAAVEAEVHRYFHTHTTEESSIGYVREWVQAPLKRIMAKVDELIAGQEAALARPPKQKS